MGIKTGLLPETIKSLEEIEINAWEDFYIYSPEEIKKNFAMDHKTENGVLFQVSGRADILVLNRVVGLGVFMPVTESSLKVAIDYFRGKGAKRFFIQICSDALDHRSEDLLKQCGFTHYNNWCKLERDTDLPKDISTRLRVACINSSKSEDFGKIVAESYGWPEQLKNWVTSTVEKPGWMHYLAYDNDIAVATAALYLKGNIGWLNQASTLKEYRKLGAQSALISRRIHDAAASGCKTLSVETAEDRPDQPVPSYHNLLRMGFREVYKRRNFIYYIENSA